MVDYPIATPDERADLVMLKLPLLDVIVIKSAPFRAQLARDMLEAAPEGMVSFFDIGDAGHIKVTGANGSVTYRVVRWLPESWTYDVVLVERQDSDGFVWPARDSSLLGSVSLGTVL
jgi:hypothetical protein